VPDATTDLSESTATDMNFYDWEPVSGNPYFDGASGVATTHLHNTAEVARTGNWRSPMP
jgi:hypothetical protein